VFHALVSADSVVGMISVVREADDLTLASCESPKHPETCAADRAYASVVIHWSGLASGCWGRLGRQMKATER
jgi:hypothetical protein